MYVCIYVCVYVYVYMYMYIPSRYVYVVGYRKLICYYLDTLYPHVSKPFPNHFHPLFLKLCRLCNGIGWRFSQLISTNVSS